MSTKATIKGPARKFPHFVKFELEPTQDGQVCLGRVIQEAESMQRFIPLMLTTEANAELLLLTVSKLATWREDNE